jgi:hypothetical protein
MTREREDSGQYTETVTPEDVLGVFTEVKGPVVTSGDVAEALSCSRETARRKLHRLEAMDRVASRKTAGRVVWWLTESEQVTATIDPDDPLFSGDPLLAPDEPIDETEIDSVVYGDADR